MSSRSRRRGLPVLWLLLMSGCERTIRYTTPIPISAPFSLVPAEGEAHARYVDAAAYAAAHGGRALLILEGETVVFAEGQNGHRLDEPQHLFSGTKSFSCALFAAAAAQGHLTAETPVHTLLPELPAAAGGLTVDHLLHLTSGMQQDFRSLTRDGLRTHPRIADRYAHALQLPWLHPPGTVFTYGSAHFDLLGAAIARAVGQDPLDYLREQVLDPIGLRTAGWIRDPSGNPALAYGAWTTAHEWARYGVLVRDDGVFQGERVLPAGALHGCLQGSAANPAYGRTFWLNRSVDDAPAPVDLVAERHLEESGPILWRDGPDDLVAAAGFHEQRLYIIPSRDMVIVRLSDGSRAYRDAELLRRILGPSAGTPTE